MVLQGRKKEDGSVTTWEIFVRWDGLMIDLLIIIGKIH